MVEFSTNLIASGGLVGVFLLMVLENLFPPIPSEVIMPLAGFTAARGQMSILGVILAGSLGSVAGNAVWFELARAFGNARSRALAATRIAVREAFGHGGPHYPLADHYNNDQWMYGDAHKRLVDSGDWRERIDLHTHRYMLEDTVLGLAFLASVARSATSSGTVTSMFTAVSTPSSIAIDVPSARYCPTCVSVSPTRARNGARIVRLSMRVCSEW